MQDTSLWFPYAQMKNLEVNYEVETGEGPYIQLTNGMKLLDATCSWWCMIHGYRHPEITQIIHDQADKLAHVMLGGLKNQPATALAKKLVEITPDGLNHVFFSDSGSVGMEVAMKMAVQFWQNQGQTKKYKMASLMRAYHGDTTGCMSVCDPEEGMHSLFSGLLPKHHFAPAPTASFDAPAEAVASDIAELRKVFEQHHEEIAGFLVEPLLQAAGGLNMYSPIYLQEARKLCDEFEILFIFDEVATGFGRTGKLFAAEYAEVTPDIMVLSKGLTGGYIGHAATLANERVFNAFWDDDAGKAFMHGPTFMGNPLACAVALKSIEVFERDNYLDKIADLNQLLKEELLGFRHEAVLNTRVLGAAAVIEVKDAKALHGVQDFAISHGVWLRSFDRYLYTMPPYIISADQLQKITSVMKAWFTTS
ncbi:adenosylmethionine--8-amino-7-oxononanoate transaminase [Oceanospirillum linum]|uniref:Adenosylmethionine-8-amino-7-oxononanoate aminotransferase n=1 Tax=Oceanospirillum linum TaxID=966 RepID=A0A1T1H858_OCELI|nr:adenosylmethionine--8-amino-7-oxononanoate transaminase [Oceanospirillum linum]OOV86022.1 adenosylmethionine--8-amino-7-oxononanoate transaminase [Oceanospirillum linum]SEG45543.1 adenosylmethionine-8-amino-7-oxononanoate aminotransferase [Oleiphilus messinensis]SMP34623.1 adenosylmethionine-8-amino-7-oxononanoate aminotransferase [Oceanospirillum linum]